MNVFGDSILASLRSKLPYERLTEATVAFLFPPCGVGSLDYAIFSVWHPEHSASQNAAYQRTVYNFLESIGYKPLIVAACMCQNDQLVNTSVLFVPNIRFNSAARVASNFKSLPLRFAYWADFTLSIYAVGHSADGAVKTVVTFLDHEWGKERDVFLCGCLKQLLGVEEIKALEYVPVTQSFLEVWREILKARLH